MSHQCTVKNFSQLYCCKQCVTNQICCLQCFNIKHLDQTTKKIHAKSTLEASDVYTVFLKIIHLQWLLGQKLNNSLGQFDIIYDETKQRMISQAFMGSLFVEELFQGNGVAAQQYNILKTCYKGQPISYVSLADLEKLLNKSSTQTLIKKNIKLLMEPNQEQRTMKAHLDFYTGADISYLASFISVEQEYFAEYINMLSQAKTEEQQRFSIYKYMEWREKSNNKPKDQVYYSKQFTAFIVEMYAKNANQKGLFTLNDYVINFWRYFHATLHTDPTLRKFFEEEVAFYKTFAEMMTENKQTITYLGFKIWKLNNGVSQYLNHLKNHYFLHSFMQHYIKMLIGRTYEFQTNEEKQKQSKQDWTDFLYYLKYYSALAEEKQLQFVFENFESYYAFRKQMEGFIASIKKDQKLKYEQECMNLFLNESFLDSKKKISKKFYAQFYEEQKSKRANKTKSFVEKAETLKEQLKKQEGQKFYEFIYLNFVNYCKQESITLSREVYLQFKKSVFDSTDQRYIEQTEERFKRGDYDQAEQVQDTQQEKKEEPRKLNPSDVSSKLKPIDDYELRVAEDLHHQEESDQEQPLDICLCCNDDPYNCLNQECQIMGCCTSCCF